MTNITMFEMNEGNNHRVISTDSYFNSQLIDNFHLTVFMGLKSPVKWLWLKQLYWEMHWDVYAGTPLFVFSTYDAYRVWNICMFLE